MPTEDVAMSRLPDSALASRERAEYAAISGWFPSDEPRWELFPVP